MTEAIGLGNRHAMASPAADTQPVLPAASWDPDAFERFYRAHAPAVYRYIYFRTGMDKTIAGEVTGDVFLALWGRARPATGEEIPVLYGIARRKIADYFRTRERSREIRFTDLQRAEREWIAGLLSDREEDTNPPGALSTDARRLIGEVLSGLEAAAQELLINKYIHRKAVRELAVESGKSEAAVTSALARARLAFRQAFESRVTHGT
jgi:RNA polymerase sigma-70 factor (ECF subfamily)